MTTNTPAVKTFAVDLSALDENAGFAAIGNHVSTQVPITIASKVLGDGFAVLETKNKSRLVGVKFLILDWKFTTGDKGEFVSARIVTEDDKRIVLNDGSTGIRDQLKQLTESGIYGGVLVNRGLRRSDYKHTNDAGKEESATTYYLDASADV